MQWCIYTFRDQNCANYGIPCDILLKQKLDFEETRRKGINAFELWC